MQRVLILIVAGVLGAGIAQAQTSSAPKAAASTQSQAGTSTRKNHSGVQASGNGSASASSSTATRTGRESAGLSEGTRIDGRLVKSLDTKKSRPGDLVEARTIQDVKQRGRVVLPKGTRLIGHITRVQARGKGQSHSILGVAFDRAELRNGKQMPLHLAIQALATTQAAMQASMGNTEMAGMGGGTRSSMGAGAAGGGLVGGTLGATTGVAGGMAGGIEHAAGATPGSIMDATANSTGTVGGLDIGGILAPSSRGVFGLRGVSLKSSTSGKTEGSTLVSSKRNIHLAGGTQMLLRVEGQSR